MPANNSAYPTYTVNALVVNSTSSSAVSVAGGVTITGALSVTGAITGGSISYGTTTTGNLSISDTSGTSLAVASTTQSTSVGTGSAVFQGGISMYGNCYIGGTLVAGAVTYSTTSTGSLDITTGTGTTLTVESTTDSTSKTTGAATISGGLGVAKFINSGSLKCFDNVQATSTTSGTVQIVGGIGVTGNNYVGGSLIVTNTSPSTSSSTGCAIFTGGIGVGESLNVGTVIKSVNLEISSTATANSPTTGAIKCVGGISSQDNIYAGGNLYGAVISSTSTTASTSTSTGSIICLGGIGIAGAANADTIKSWSSTAATSTTTGSIITPGGLGVGGKVFSDTIQTVGSAVVGGFDMILGNADQTTRGNSGSSRALVKDLDGTNVQLHVNYNGDFDQVILGSDTGVKGNIDAANFYSYPITLTSQNVVGSFHDTPDLKVNIFRVGPNHEFLVKYKFTLLAATTIEFETKFFSEFTLLSPINRLSLGSGYVTCFTPPYLVDGEYITENENRFCFPITGILEMQQVAANTVDGTPDGSEGYNYTFKVYDGATPFIQLGTFGGASTSNQITFNPDLNVSYGGQVSTFEVYMNFKVPVYGYDTTFTPADPLIYQPPDTSVNLGDLYTYPKLI